MDSFFCVESGLCTVDLSAFGLSLDPFEVHPFCLNLRHNVWGRALFLHFVGLFLNCVGLCQLLQCATPLLQERPAEHRARQIDSIHDFVIILLDHFASQGRA